MTGMARVRELLAEARKALALRDRMAVTGDDAGAVDETLRGLYHDLGRALVAVVEAGEAVILEPGSGVPLDGAVMPGGDDEDDAIWRPIGAGAAGATAADEILGLDPYDDSTPVIPPEREFTAEEPADYVVTAVAELRAAAAVPGSAFHLFRTGAPSWEPSLRQLMQLLALPANFADVSELAVESSRLQWASNDLAPRLEKFPQDIRLALVAMMAARAHHLRLRLDSDVGPRLSLERLRRYRLDTDLPAVAGLTPTPRPETGSWEGDARQWWALLAGEDG